MTVFAHELENSTLPMLLTVAAAIPGAALVRSLPYRWLHHPNYTAVAVEVAALALVHSAWLTAIEFSIANALVLSVRIRAENAPLGYTQAIRVR